MPTKRRPQPRRQRAQARKPVMQDTWPETVLNVPETPPQTSGFVWLALALFVCGMIWALLPSRKPEALPALSAPTQRANVPPARQSAPASAPKPAKASSTDKALRRADAGAPRRKVSLAKAASPTLAPTIPAWAQAEPKTAGVPPAPVLSLEADKPGQATPAAIPSGSKHKVRAWRAEGQSAEVAVFGPRNKRVALLRSESGPAGWVSLSWDEKNEAGAKVAKGLYYLRPSVKSEQVVEEAWVE